MLRIALFSFACVLGLWCSGCRENPAPPAASAAQSAPVLARWHFVGADLIAADTNASKVKELASLPETQELEKFLFEKLARVPFRLFVPGQAKTTNDFAANLEPLLAELWRVESVGEWRGGEGKALEFTLAVRLSEARAREWSAALESALTSWTGAAARDIQVGAFKGREVRLGGGSNLVQWLPAPSWWVIRCGPAGQAGWQAMLDMMKSGTRPTDVASNYWLSLSMDWPRLKPWLALPEYMPLPPSQLKLEPRAENLRLSALLKFREPLKWSAEEWTVPTNTIREPLISFTAFRPGKTWLNSLPPFKLLSLGQTPGQIYFWALSDSPMQSFVAMPMSDATNEMAQFAPRLMEQFNATLSQRAIGTLRWKTNAAFFYWEGLPFAVPFLQPVSEDSAQILLGGFFPNSPKRSPFPAELLTQLAPTNLLYYDWEITADRLAQLRQSVQLAFIIADLQQYTTNQPAQKWLLAAGPKLGNTVTAATLSSPDTLSIVRSGHAGLTAVELVALAAWITSPDFPLTGIQLPPEAGLKKRMKPANTNQPNAETGR